jgi:hypothetical protein
MAGTAVAVMIGIVEFESRPIIGLSRIRREGNKPKVT